MFSKEQLLSKIKQLELEGKINKPKLPKKKPLKEKVGEVKDKLKVKLEIKSV